MSETSDEYNLRDQRPALRAIERERKACGMSLGDMEEKCGVSINSFYSWRSAERSPTVDNLVKLAEGMGFEIVIRRRK